MSICEGCGEYLVIFVAASAEDETDDQCAAETTAEDQSVETLPDDLELPCGCHFHWQCFLEHSPAVAMSLKCPNCDAYLPANASGPSTTNPFLPTTSEVAILTKYINEGGIQQDLDILPFVTEEAHFQNHPEAATARALHIMCAEGDIDGIVRMFKNPPDEVGDLGPFIRYQDPLFSMKTGLHLAVENGREEVVWLLLWLSSALPTPSFPELARNEANSMGLSRLPVQRETDIRVLVDAQGQTAEKIAQRSPGHWSSLIDAGFLSP